IYPAILIDAGLGPALRSLADTAPVVMQVLAGDARFPPAVEAAAYFAVAEAVHAAGGAVRVDVTGALVVTITGARRSGATGDRVGGRGGTVVPTADGLRLEIPCG